MHTAVHTQSGPVWDWSHDGDTDLHVGSEFVGHAGGEVTEQTHSLGPSLLPVLPAPGTQWAKLQSYPLTQINQVQQRILPRVLGMGGVKLLNSPSLHVTYSSSSVSVSVPGSSSGSA